MTNAVDFYKALLPVIQAFTEGKVIQFKSSYVKEDWRDFRSPLPDDYPAFTSSSWRWRVKPEEEYAYCNLYKSEAGRLWLGGGYTSREAAEGHPKTHCDRVGCIKVKLEEGRWAE